MTMAPPTDARPVSIHAQDPEVLAWAGQFCRAVGHRAAEAAEAAEAGVPAAPVLQPQPAASAEAVAEALANEPDAAAAPAPIGWLIYTPPAWALLRGDAAQPAAALKAWEAAHAPMLRTATLNPALRLVNAMALLHAPQALAAHLLDEPAEAVDLSLPAIERGALGPLAAELASRGSDPAALHAEALYQSLEAMASLDGEALGLAAAERTAAALELKALRQALADLALDRDRREAELAAQVAREDELLRLQLHQMQEELEAQLQAQREADERANEQAQALTAREAELAQARQATETASRDAAERLRSANLAAAEAGRESGLLQAQLRQAQDELALQWQAKAALETLVSQRDGELRTLREAAAASQQEADLLLSQLHQVQEELEAMFLRRQEESLRAKDIEQAQAALGAERDALRAERDAFARDLAQLRVDADARGAQLQGQIQHLAQELDQQHIERALLASDADERKVHGDRQRDALQRDNELLLQQIQQLQENLEQSVRRHRTLQEAEESRARQVRRLQAHAHAVQPDTVRVDLRQAIDGDGWHEAEPDGRWSGPETTSRLRLPALAAGAYHVQLDVVDALAPDVLDGAALDIAGVPVRLEALEPGLPAQLMGLVELPDVGALEWELSLRTPRVVSPRDGGVPDDRLLGLRVRSLALTRLG